MLFFSFLVKEHCREKMWASALLTLLCLAQVGRGTVIRETRSESREREPETGTGNLRACADPEGG